MTAKESYYHIYDTPTSIVVRDESYDYLEAYVYAPPKIKLNIYKDGVMSNNTFMFKIFQYILKENSAEDSAKGDFTEFLTDYGSTFAIDFSEVPKNI